MVEVLLERERRKLGLVRFFRVGLYRVCMVIVRLWGVF